MEIGDLENSGSNDAQKKRSRESIVPGEGLEETNVMNEAGNIFLQLSNKIDSAESKNKDASRGLIYSYFDFGKLYLNDTRR
uniref:Uncharacterized protein n=1 Tax=Rhizophagus irregularis (strain DAOM 181602 / DAOM 197198 / MUCL 43194) TaxID=747089 RepID=U9T7G5_RHIID